MNFIESLELYKKYLTTERLDWQKQMRRPLKPTIFKAMCSTHQKIGEDPEGLINKVIKNKGKIFFWSDQHFFHHNIIKYASRPFDSISHMNQTMLNNYYQNVKEEDLVVFCGDVSFGDVVNTRDFLKGLPGKKVLVMGNHDFEKNDCKFRNYHLFDCVTMSFRMDLDIEEQKFELLVSHYPIDSSLLPKNTFNVHGHIHQHTAGLRNINVSVEHTNYSPIEIEYRILNSL